MKQTWKIQTISQHDFDKKKRISQSFHEISGSFECQQFILLKHPLPENQLCNWMIQSIEKLFLSLS